MKQAWVLLAVSLQVLSLVASAAVLFPPVLVNPDTDHSDVFVFSRGGRGSNKTLVDVLKENKLMDTADLINRAGLTKNFTSKGNFTVLAPTDSALDKLPYDVRMKLLTDTKFAKVFVEYHVLRGIVPSSSLTQDQVSPTLLQNRTVRFNQYTVDNKAVITVNGAVLDKVDLQASNGVVHVISKGLWPQAEYNIMDAISNTKSLSTLAKAISDAKMNETFKGAGPFTIFAPTNEAFKKYGAIDKANVLVEYHSVKDTYYTAGLSDKEELTTMRKFVIRSDKLTVHIKDGQVSVSGHKKTAAVTVADIPVNNGVLHIIDTVLPPPLV